MSNDFGLPACMESDQSSFEIPLDAYDQNIFLRTSPLGLEAVPPGSYYHDLNVAPDATELNGHFDHPPSHNVTAAVGEEEEAGGCSEAVHAVRTLPESSCVEQVLTKTSYEDEPFLRTVIATLAAYRFQNDAMGMEVKMPSVFEKYLLYDQTLELPRGPTYRVGDLSKHSYIREKRRGVEKQRMLRRNDGSETQSKGRNLNPLSISKKFQIVFKSDAGSLLKLGAGWKPIHPDSEITVWIFYLIANADVNEVIELLKQTSQPRAAAGAGGTGVNGPAHEADSTAMDSLSDRLKFLIGPCLCVALPHNDGPRHAGKRKASEPLSDLVERCYAWAVESKRLLSKSAPEELDDLDSGSGAQTREQSLKSRFRGELEAMLDKLEKEGRWPDFMFEKGLMIPCIQTIWVRAMKEGHLPGMVSEMRVKEGDFDAKREIRSVLMYIELFLHWFRDGEDRMAKLERAVKRCEEERANSEIRMQEVVKLLEECSPEQPTKLWHDKFLIKLHEFQYDSIAQCLEKNTIVNLDTGKGKTLIAIKVMDHLLRKNEGKNALFIVPTRALVKQQAQAIRHFSQVLPTCGSAEHWFCAGVAELAGMQMDAWTEEDWAHCLLQNRVLVGTPAIFERALITNSFIDVSRFCILVFDECHNAVGNHPMAVIMRRAVSCMDSDDERPRIIGLTASFVNGRVRDEDIGSKRIELCRTLQANMHTPNCPVEQLKSYHPVAWEASPLAKEDAAEFAEQFVAPLLAPVRALKRVRDQDKVVRHAAHVLCQLGFNAFQYYMTDGLAAELEAMAERWLEQNYPAGSTLLQEKKAEILNQQLAAKKTMQERFDEMASDLSGSAGLQAWTNKAETLMQLLQRVLQETGGPGIVFCAQNCLVHPIRHLCKLNGFEAEAVAGVGYMTEAKRDFAIGNFRAQKLKLLISTPAVEEGLDIPECRFVVRFDKFDTTKSHVQGSGRARHKDAEIYYFDNDIETEECRSALLKRVAGNADLDLDLKELTSGASAGVIPGKHPFPLPSAGEGVVHFHNCLQIFHEYCVKVLGQDVQIDEFLQYNDIENDINDAVLETSRFPSQNGWTEVSRQDVDEYWGGAVLEGPGLLRKKDDTQKKRFLFVVVVKMRQLGVLDHQNVPCREAVQYSSAVCKLPAFESGLTIRPKYNQSEIPTPTKPFPAHDTWTGPDFKSMLNLLCHQHGLTCQYSEPTRTADSAFVSTVCIKRMTLRSNDNQWKYTGTPFFKKKDAEQAAAKLAYESLAAKSDPVTPDLNSDPDGRCSASETDSPAASSRGEFTLVRVFDADISPTQNYKSLLNDQKKRLGVGNVLYQTTSSDGGLFVCTAVMGDKTFDGAPCLKKKDAEQAAAKLAYESLEATMSASTPPSHVSSDTDHDGRCSESETVADSPAALSRGNSASALDHHGCDVSSPQNYKSLLNDQKKRAGNVLYQTTSSDGGLFVCTAVMGDKTFDGAPCLKKKDAEQAAAKLAYESLEATMPAPTPPSRVSSDTDHDGRCSESETVADSPAALSRGNSASALDHHGCDVSSPQNYKSLLNDQKKRAGNVLYQTTSSDGGLFVCTAVMGDKTFDGAPCLKKKDAEQAAAKLAYESLEATMPAPTPPSRVSSDTDHDGRCSESETVADSPAALSRGNSASALDHHGCDVSSPQNYKSLLNDQKKRAGNVLYQTTSSDGGLFVCTAVMGDKTFDGAPCLKKKDAEQAAAKLAYESLEATMPAPNPPSRVSFDPDTSRIGSETDFKSLLNSQSKRVGHVQYQTTMTEGGMYICTAVVLNTNEHLPGPPSKSKKVAEQLAAKEVWFSRDWVVSSQ